MRSKLVSAPTTTTRPPERKIQEALVQCKHGRSVTKGCVKEMIFLDVHSYQQQMRVDATFLCAHTRMDQELLETLVLQLNRIHPQVLSDTEACRFRSLAVPSKVRLVEMLAHLRWRGEDACHEFYRGLHIHAENIYCGLPSRLALRETLEPTSCTEEEPNQEPSRGPLFFLKCFSFLLGTAMLYYSRDDERLTSTGLFLHCSAARFGENSKQVFIY